MLPTKLAFVDIETTGSKAGFDRILEIGILRVEENTIVKSFSSLINPEVHIPPEIQRLTGILPSDIENAPTFYQVKDEVLELLKDCIFVAHNVRFDYGFIKSELKRQEKEFSAKQLCTVKLSRLLFPQFPRHNLDAIIERFGFRCANRHRAFDDAKIITDFYFHLNKTLQKQTFEEALDRVLKKPSLPLHLSPEDLEQLPEAPGVYIFYGEDKTPLYIGKSVNLRERVHSHFSADIHSSTEMKISQQIREIKTQTTAGELGALFLESQLIKTMLPLYNKRLRLKKQLTVLKNKRDEHGYERIRIEVVDDITASDIKSLQEDHEKEGIIGFFKSQKQAKDYLLTIAQEYALCERLLGIEKTSSACFGYRLGRCKGACMQEEASLFYNMRFMNAVSARRIKPWPFPGPIIIEESHPTNQKRQVFLIDKWCYLGSVTTNEDSHPQELSREVLFDLDIYKILKQYLLKPTNQKRIKLLRQTELPFLQRESLFTLQ